MVWPFGYDSEASFEWTGIMVNGQAEVLQNQGYNNNCGGCDWFWARETSWGVLVRELSVTFIPSSNILQSIVDSFLGRNYEWRPKVAEKKCLSMGTIETLYDRFGISDLLLREKSWKYK